MNHRIALPLLPVLLLALVAATPAPVLADAVAAPAAPTAPAGVAAAQADAGEPVGGRDYFFCAAFQVIKYAGMITGRPEAVLAGAIGSGVACAYGW